MTNKNSARWLKDMLENFDLPQEQYQTALAMAIKALENEEEVYMRGYEQGRKDLVNAIGKAKAESEEA